MEATLLWMVLLGLVVGTYGTIIGAGGGFMLVPLMLFFYPEYGPEKVTAISLAVVWANATSGSVAYARDRRIDLRTGLLFAASSVPGAIAGALVVRHVPERAFHIMFGVLLLAIVGLLMLQRDASTIREPLARRPGVLVRNVITPDGIRYRYAYWIWQGVGLSALIGFASSLFGIGGGVMNVPAMVLIFHIPLSFAVATSQFVLAFMAGGATVVHLASGTLTGLALRQAIALGVGAVAGAQLGAAVARRVSNQTVFRLLALALVVLAARLLLKGLFEV